MSHQYRYYLDLESCNSVKNTDYYCVIYHKRQYPFLILLIGLVIAVLIICSSALVFASEKVSTPDVDVETQSIEKVSGEIEVSTAAQDVKKTGNCRIVFRITAHNSGSLSFRVVITATEGSVKNDVFLRDIQRGTIYQYELLTSVPGNDPHVSIGSLRFLSQAIIDLRESGLDYSKLAQISATLLALVFFAIAIVLGLGFLSRKFLRENQEFILWLIMTSIVLGLFYIACLVIALISDLQFPYGQEVKWAHYLLILIVSISLPIELYSSYRLLSVLPRNTRFVRLRLFYSLVITLSVLGLLTFCFSWILITESGHSALLQTYFTYFEVAVILCLVSIGVVLLFASAVQMTMKLQELPRDYKGVGLIMPLSRRNKWVLTAIYLLIGVSLLIPGLLSSNRPLIYFGIFFTVSGLSIPQIYNLTARSRDSNHSVNKQLKLEVRELDEQLYRQRILMEELASRLATISALEPRLLAKEQLSDIEMSLREKLFRGEAEILRLRKRKGDLSIILEKWNRESRRCNTAKSFCSHSDRKR